MKKLDISWKGGIPDATGYLFSLAKSLGTALAHSPYADRAQDIVATSGFAFRTWVRPDLCPSATSIWDFEMQKPWAENGGLHFEYVGRYWNQDHFERDRRERGIALIRASVDSGIPAVVWDIGVPEWGLITGYDDERGVFSALSVNGSEPDVAYDALGKREIPILSVLTVTGSTQKSKSDILRDTLRLAVHHLRGREWCDISASGLAAYPALLRFFREGFEPEQTWCLTYYLGTYAALKQYACLYFEKYGLEELATLYKEVFDGWMAAFAAVTGPDASQAPAREAAAHALEQAQTAETAAAERMERMSE